jgi:hypothetical protein
MFVETATLTRRG